MRVLRVPRMLGMVLIVAVVFAGGCSNDGLKLGEVRGRVTLDGDPVPNAIITFTPEFSGRPSTTRTNADGEYELQFNPTRKGALVGDHQVRVSTEDITPDDKHIPEIIPVRYHKKGSIAVTVEKGKNQIDLDLITEPGDETAKKKK